MEKTIVNKHSYDEVSRPFPKYENFSFSEEISKYEDEDNIGVDWECELISDLDDLKKLMKENKAP